jgi:pyruvate formate lyase activating enzyme
MENRLKVKLKFKIKGFIPVTMIDWDGKIASTLFLGDCSYRCPFCQNAELVLSSQTLSDIPWDVVRDHLVEKKNWIDGVVVTGGEPCVNDGLIELLREIKKLDCLVKIDTNGSRPDVLQKVIENNLVDYIAMDVKTSLERYAAAAGVSVDTNAIKKSIDLILNSGIDHEFRTTLVPCFVSEEDVLKIANYIKNANLYVIQQFSPENVLDSSLEGLKPYPKEEVLRIADICQQIVFTKIRGVGL